eukprot:3940232-Rhodomonas_salina.1
MPSSICLGRARTDVGHLGTRKSLPVAHHAMLLCLSLMGALQSPFFFGTALRPSYAMPVYCMLDYLRMSGGQVTAAICLRRR